MMFLFRSSFVTTTLFCAIAVISQFASVHAAPQLGMRPKLHVYGVDATGSEFESILSPTATVEFTGASSIINSALESAGTAETTQLPDSSSNDDDGGTVNAAQTNSAATIVSGLGTALIIGSIAAVIQFL